MLRLTLAFRPEDGPQHEGDPGGSPSGWSPWLELGRQIWDLGGMWWLSRSSWKPSYIWWSGGVLLYGWSCLSEMRPASLLKATVADRPQPPFVDRTRGVKVPFSIWEHTVGMLSSSRVHVFCSKHRWRMYNSPVHGSWRFWHQRRLIVCFCPRNFGVKSCAFLRCFWGGICFWIC